MQPVSDKSLQAQLAAFKPSGSQWTITYNGQKLDKNVLGAATLVWKTVSSNPSEEALVHQITAQFGTFLSHSPTRLRHILKNSDSAVFLLQLVFSFLKRGLLEVGNFTDQNTEKWCRAMRGIHEIVVAIEQAAILTQCGSAFVDALQRCAAPTCYSRSEVEALQVSKEQKPMVELLVSLLERERDDDLLALTADGRTTMSFIDLLQSVEDNALAKDYRTALQALSSSKTSAASVPVEALMAGGNPMLTFLKLMVFEL